MLPDGTCWQWVGGQAKTLPCESLIVQCPSSASTASHLSNYKKPHTDHKPWRQFLCLRKVALLGLGLTPTVLAATCAQSASQGRLVLAGQWRPALAVGAVLF
jgi:hypothetical protein